jgi:putative ABC transport system permease protein
VFGHHLRTALRSLWRYRIAASINLLCLSLGLACVVLCYAVVHYLEQSDAQFPKATRIRVLTTNLYAPGIKLTLHDLPFTGPVVARFVRTELPWLEAVARAESFDDVPVSAEGRATYAKVDYADPGLLDIFDFVFLSGDGHLALRNPHGAVITAPAARRIFHLSDAREALGRRLLVSGREEVTVTGVMAPVRRPSNFQFDVLANVSVHDRLAAAAGMSVDQTGANFRDWWSIDHPNITYVLLPPNVAAARQSLQAQLVSFADRHVRGRNPELQIGFGLIPVTALRLNVIESELAGFAHVAVSIVAIAYLLAGLILLIACVNYANLAAALTLARAKEIGVNKVLGAARRQLVGRHLLETALTVFAALLCALALVALLVPIVRRMGFEIGIEALLRPQFLGVAVLLVAAVTVLGGAYPAVLLSSIRPAHALGMPCLPMGPRPTPRFLTFAQFAASSFMLILVLVMHAQNGIARRAISSLALDPAVSLLTNLESAHVSLEVLRQRLLSCAYIESVTASTAPPVSLIGSPLVLARSAAPGSARITTTQLFVSYDFFATLGMRVIAGRDFSRDRADASQASAPSATAARGRIVLDARAAAQLGWADPRTAVGQLLYVPRTGGGVWGEPIEVVGVVERRPLSVLGVGAESSVYQLMAPSTQSLYPIVRISRRHVGAALRDIDSVWNGLAPNIALRRQFMGELLERTYRPVVTVEGLMSALAAFGLGIAAMGLLGAAIHLTDRRLHEIGVRKTLGARRGQIIALLLRDFSKPVLLANLLAWPLALLGARVYLSLFTDRATLTLTPFLLALAITIGVACCAVFSRVLRAASAEPAVVLRYE